MKPAIPAIETIYRGNRFRSRTEAKWAVFFDLVGVRYEFEPQGVALRSGAYLPDFWLPDSEAWFEVKGSWEAVDSLAKYGQLAELGRRVLIAGGQPGRDHEIAMASAKPWPFGEVAIGSKFEESEAWLWPWALRFCRSGTGIGLSSSVPLFHTGGKAGGALSVHLTGEAGALGSCASELQKVGMARFEHGESGARR